MSNRQKPKNRIPLGTEPYRGPAHVAKWRQQQQVQRTPHHGINAYHCDTCDKNTVTIDVDPGVTPMFLACRRTPDCPGQATSSGYPSTEPPPAVLLRLEWEWALPTVDQFRKLSPEMKAHVDAGGLVLQPYSGRPSAYIGTEVAR